MNELVAMGPLILCAHIYYDIRNVTYTLPLPQRTERSGNESQLWKEGTNNPSPPHSTLKVIVVGFWEEGREAEEYRENILTEFVYDE